MSKKVYVGMSGGVDSSVTAAVLVKKGYEVTGVYMKNWTRDLPGLPCKWQDDFEDAKRVAVQLGINFKVYDFENQYKQKVVDYMLDEYRTGRAPNPDIMCNQEIKFKLFLNTALEDGAEAVATGHYARTQIVKNVKGRTFHILVKARDATKDQTYFMYRIDQKALRKVLLPLGEFESKEEVRSLAKKLGLVTADKKDSQGICFVGEINIKEFLSRFIKSEPGPVIDQSDKKVGEHEGAVYYTIGQRHGLGVGGGLPYYVTRKDMATNTVYVTTNLDDKDLWTKKIILENTHWINEPPNPNKKYDVRLRHRGLLTKCQIEGNELTLDNEQRAVAPGQSAVIYEGSRVAGGGVVSETVISHFSIAPDYT